MNRHALHHTPKWVGPLPLLAIGLGLLILMLSSCSGGPPPLEHVELEGPNETKIDAYGLQADTTVRTTDVADYLGEKGYPRTITRNAQERAYRLQKAFVRGRDQRYRAEESRIEALARTLYGEAAEMQSQTKVGEVVLTRVRSPEHPNTIESVIEEPWAFTSITRNARQLDTLGLEDYHDGPKAYRRAVKAAYAVLAMPDSLREVRASHFYSPVSMPRWKPRPEWAAGRTPSHVVGDRFRFYRISKQGDRS